MFTLKACLVTGMSIVNTDSIIDEWLLMTHVNTMTDR